MFTKNSKVRLLISNRQNAKLNMATDNALINMFKENDTPIFRIYSWQKSFTLGVSQKLSDFSYICDYKHNFAKRVTGGGLLYHGHDISYSLIIPKSYMNNLNVKETYEEICTFILEFYTQLGLKSSFAKDIHDIQLSKNKFCQIGYEAYDIIVNSVKLGGNAQKRTKNIIFQHGSIPLEKIKNNNFKELGKSLYDLDIKLTYDKAQLIMIKSFEKVFNVKLEKSLLSKVEKDNIELLLKDKYNYDK